MVPFKNLDPKYTIYPGTYDTLPRRKTFAYRKIEEETGERPYVFNQIAPERTERFSAEWEAKMTRCKAYLSSDSVPVVPRARMVEVGVLDWEITAILTAPTQLTEVELERFISLLGRRKKSLGFYSPKTGEWIKGDRKGSISKKVKKRAPLSSPVCDTDDEDDDDEDDDEDDEEEVEPADTRQIGDDRYNDDTQQQQQEGDLDADAPAASVADGGPNGNVLEKGDVEVAVNPAPAAGAAGDAPPPPPLAPQIPELPAAKAVEPDPATLLTAPADAAGPPADPLLPGGTPEQEGASEPSDQPEGDRDRGNEAITPVQPKVARKRTGSKRRSPKKKKAKKGIAEGDPVTPAPPDPKAKYMLAAVKAFHEKKANTGAGTPTIPAPDAANITDIPEPATVSAKTGVTAPVTGTAVAASQSNSSTSAASASSSATGNTGGSPSVQGSRGRGLRSKGPISKDPEADF
jgi:hypothetical protein